MTAPALSAELVSKFQAILVSWSPAEYLKLTMDERKLYDAWRDAVVRV